MTTYIIGLLGMWLFCDGIVSVKLYWKESWLSCHSIRLVRIGIGIVLMVYGAMA